VTVHDFRDDVCVPRMKPVGVQYSFRDDVCVPRMKPVGVQYSFPYHAVCNKGFFFLSPIGHS